MKRQPVVHLVAGRNGVAWCGKIVRSPEMRWTYQLALTTCKRCLASKKEVTK